MLRVFLVILFLMCSVAFAQTGVTPQAVKVDEFERATNGYVKMKMDYFYNELNNNPAAQGYIINYGTAREILIREKQIRVSIQWRRFDAARITFVNGGFRDEVKTEFWLVPPGADNPQPESNAKMFDEFGNIPDGNFKARLQGLYVELVNYFPNSRAVILHYGSGKSIAVQEARVRRVIRYLKLDPKLVTIKTGGYGKDTKTEFWIVPEEEKKQVKTEIYIVTPGAKPPQ